MLRGDSRPLEMKSIGNNCLVEYQLQLLAIDRLNAGCFDASRSYKTTITRYAHTMAECKSMRLIYL